MKKHFAIPLFTLAGAGLAGAVYAAYVRPWMLHWGTTPAEAYGPLPGDHLVQRPRAAFTRAITLRAPPSAVWPWLVQIGSHRAGWYSYDRLDNAGHPSADQIVPELQRLEVGDEIWAAADGTLAFTVAALEPDRALVLSGPLDVTTPFDERRTAFSEPAALDPVRASWAFVLQPVGGARSGPTAETRLVVRFRADYPPNPLSALAGALLEPVSFLMERKMLLGIKTRVEANAL